MIIQLNITQCLNYRKNDMKITLEEVENLIDKIITLNTWLRITHLNIFKEPISFEVFNKMWWSPYL